MNPELLKARNNIVDVIACSDGGVRFIHFCAFLEEFDKREKNGDIAAGQLLNVVYQFSQLLDIIAK